MFVRDMRTGTTSLECLSSTGAVAKQLLCQLREYTGHFMSADGPLPRVLLEREQHHSAVAAGNQTDAFYLRDRVRRTTTRVDVSNDGSSGRWPTAGHGQHRHLGQRELDRVSLRGDQPVPAEHGRTSRDLPAGNSDRCSLAGFGSKRWPGRQQRQLPTLVDDGRIGGRVRVLSDQLPPVMTQTPGSVRQTSGPTAATSTYTPTLVEAIRHGQSGITLSGETRACPDAGPVRGRRLLAVGAAWGES